MELTRYSKYPEPPPRRLPRPGGDRARRARIKRSGGRVRLAAQKPSSHADQRLRRSVWVRVGGRWRDLAQARAAGRARAVAAQRRRERPQPRVPRARPAAPPPPQARALRPGRLRRRPRPGPPVAVDRQLGRRRQRRAEPQRRVGGRPQRRRRATCASAAGGCATPACASGATACPATGFPAGDGRPGRRHAARARRLRRSAAASVLHWCLKESAFENARRAPARSGDGALPVRPAGRPARVGDLSVPGGVQRPAGRAACAVDGAARRAESIAVTNIERRRPSTSAATCSSCTSPAGRTSSSSATRSGPARCSAPGETLRMRPGGSPDDDTPLVRHLGRGPFVLADGKGVGEPAHGDDLVTACEAWGRRTCR